MLPDVPYVARFGFLLLILAVAALVDWWLYGNKATRWREYLFLLAAGTVGGLFGIFVDHITATLSEEYFTLGKGISPGDGFRWRVTALGFQAGFGAGVVIGGGFLLANNPKPHKPGLPYPLLATFMAVPILAALLITPPAALLLDQLDPFHLTESFHGLMSDVALKSFLTVWSIHAGVYLGGILGTVCAVLLIRRRRGR